MRFHEKLDFLMNITATTNVLISQKIGMDPSYLSRLRRGERKPIQDRFIIETMAGHFVRNAALDYQIDLLGDMMHPAYKNTDELGRIVLLSDWLCDKGIILEHEPETSERNEEVNEGNSGMYFGREGKRQAILRFLSIILKSKGTKPILFFDDSDSTWLLEDGEFKQKVQRGLEAAIEKGHRIIIIHNTKRPLHDMLKAIELWFPIHFTGMAEAYYYPKVRDDLFKRTLCVVPENAAVVANAVEEEIESTPHFLVMDPAAIKSFEDEFLQLLKRCQPLFKTYNSNEGKTLSDLTREYGRVKGDNFYNMKDFSPLVTLGAIQPNQKELFEEKFAEDKHYEVVYKKSREELAGHKKEEYLGHLEKLINLAEEFNNFHFVLDEKQTGPDLPLYLKEGKGAILVSPFDGIKVLHTKESGITAALYDYLKHSTALGKYKDRDKAQQIEKLKSYIKEI